MSLPSYPMPLHGYGLTPPSWDSQVPPTSATRRVGHPTESTAADTRDHGLTVCTAIALGSLSLGLWLGAIARYSFHFAQAPASPTEIPASMKALALSQLP